MKVFARANIDVTVGVGPLDFGFGLSQDIGIQLNRDGIEVKALGAGFAVTKEKLELCLAFCFTINFKRIVDYFGRRKRYVGEMSAFEMVQEWHSELTLRSGKAKNVTAVELLSKANKILNRTWVELEREAGKQTLAEVCKSKEKAKKQRCINAHAELDVLDTFADAPPLVRNFTKIVAKTGDFAHFVDKDNKTRPIPHV